MTEYRIAVREEKLPVLSDLGGIEGQAIAPEARSTATEPTAGAEVASAPQAATKAGRFAALDLLRFLAVVMMVQGHTFREVLETAVRAERWHGYHNYVHGYTAPIFLFSSGLAFGITTFRSWEKHLGWGPTLLKRLERYALLLMIGYAIRMPHLSLTTLLHTPREALSPILEVDALQNIGVTLALAELTVVALRTRKRFVALIASLTVLAVVCAPAIWRLDVSEVPVFFAAYVNAGTGSIFPLAPWSAFLLTGILTAHLLWDPATRGVRPNAHVLLFALGACTLLVGRQLTSAHLDGLWGEHNYWKTSPYFFLVRIGVVWMVLAALTWSANRFPALSGRKAKLVQTLGQETLVIYVGHLFVLYGSPVSRGIVPFVGPTLGVLESTLLVLAVFVAMIALALSWHAVKTRYPKPFDRTRRAITAALVLVFLFT
jgi:fucose 4-O-acetylase-like acetyltransferase